MVSRYLGMRHKIESITWMSLGTGTRLTLATIPLLFAIRDFSPAGKAPAGH
jgi:hypothetical protein